MKKVSVIIIPLYREVQLRAGQKRCGCISERVKMELMARPELWRYFEMSKSKVIRLDASKVNDFVNATARCEFDIDIMNTGRNGGVDAKSYLGIMGLDLTKDLTVEYDGEDEAFEALLNSLAAKTE